MGAAHSCQIQDGTQFFHQLPLPTICLLQHSCHISLQSKPTFVPWLFANWECQWEVADSTSSSVRHQERKEVQFSFLFSGWSYGTRGVYLVDRSVSVWYAAVWNHRDLGGMSGFGSQKCSHPEFCLALRVIGLYISWAVTVRVSVPVESRHELWWGKCRDCRLWDNTMQEEFSISLGRFLLIWIVPISHPAKPSPDLWRSPSRLKIVHCNWWWQSESTCKRSLVSEGWCFINATWEKTQGLILPSLHVTAAVQSSGQSHRGRIHLAHTHLEYKPKKFCSSPPGLPLGSCPGVSHSAEVGFGPRVNRFRFLSSQQICGLTLQDVQLNMPAICLLLAPVSSNSLLRRSSASSDASLTWANSDTGLHGTVPVLLPHIGPPNRVDPGFSHLLPASLLPKPLLKAALLLPRFHIAVLPAHMYSAGRLPMDPAITALIGAPE